MGQQRDQAAKGAKRDHPEGAKRDQPAMAPFRQSNRQLFPRGEPGTDSQPRNCTQERQAGGTQGIAGNIRLRNEQAGARILLEVLGVHRHAADE